MFIYLFVRQVSVVSLNFWFFCPNPSAGIIGMCHHTQLRNLIFLMQLVHFTQHTLETAPRAVCTVSPSLCSSVYLFLPIAITNVLTPAPLTDCSPARWLFLQNPGLASSSCSGHGRPWCSQPSPALRGPTSSWAQLTSTVQSPARCHPETIVQAEHTVAQHRALHSHLSRSLPTGPAMPFKETTGGCVWPWPSGSALPETSWCN